MLSMRTTVLLTLIVSSLVAKAQEEIPLYENEIPNSRKSEKVSQHLLSSKDGITRIAGVTNPVLYAYFPEKQKNTGKAVLIFPGGGYGILAIGHEGHDVAKRFAAQGISAFVVMYRLPNAQVMLQKDIGPLQDAQRAIQLVREQATEWAIHQHEVGVLGFSAGGHLASTLSTHYQQSFIPNPDHINLRPDFMILAYPVISMSDELTHLGSRTNLLGSSPSEEQLILFSNERQVTQETPPAFLIHAEDDNAVPIKNSLVFKQALENHQVAVELLVYPKGGHGFGLNNSTSDIEWFPQVVDWIVKL